MKLIRIVAVISVISMSSISNADVLYDVNFSSNIFSNGQVVFADGEINTPSAISSGTQQVIYDFAGLPGNWAVFNTPACGLSNADEMRFDFGGSREEIFFEADIYPENLGGSDNLFSIRIDSSTYIGLALNFHTLSNEIYLFNKAHFNVGNFQNDHTYNVKIYANGLSNFISISVNDVDHYSGPLGSSDLTAIRLSLHNWTGRATNCSITNIAASNIKIYENEGDLVNVQLLDLMFDIKNGIDTVPATGGKVKYKYSITNLDSEQYQSLSRWVYLKLPGGELYPLSKPKKMGLDPGDTFKVRKASAKLPAWLPAGDYNMTLVVVDKTSGDIYKKELVVHKTPE